jgi:hypothetical protein
MEYAAANPRCLTPAMAIAHLAAQREREICAATVECLRIEGVNDDTSDNLTLDSDEHENRGYNTAIDEAVKAIQERTGCDVLDPVEIAIAGVETLAEAWGDAESYEQQLEDDRALEKQAAILRIMQTTNPLTSKPHSASSAEAVVEQDEQYRVYRQRQSAAVVAKFTARGVYEAAKLRAERLVRAEGRR